MPKILDFKGNSSSLQFRAKSPKSAEIVLYGAIGESYFGDSITAKAFSEEMKKLDSSVKEITVRINSPGGDVFDGISIYNRLKQHPAKVKVMIDGLAASIASIIALAGDEIEMGEGALYMVHLPWSMAAGNRNDFENVINRLMDVEEQMISIYSKKTKLSRQEIRLMLEKETWMSADEALEMGFIDKKYEDDMAIAASTFAASSLDKATWLSKAPKLKKKEEFLKEEIAAIQSKISGFIKDRK